MKTTVIAIKQTSKLYESTNLACEIWQEISGDVFISTSSHDSEGIQGAIAEGIGISPTNSPRKMVCEIEHFKFRQPKEIINSIVQKLQNAGWQIISTSSED